MVRVLYAGMYGFDKPWLSSACDELICLVMGWPNYAPQDRETNWEQDRIKSCKTVKFHIIGKEARSRTFSTKICIEGDVVCDVIVCSVLRKENFWYDFTEVRIFHFTVDFRMGLITVQRYCAVCDFFSEIALGSQATNIQEQYGLVRPDGCSDKPTASDSVILNAFGDI